EFRRVLFRSYNLAYQPPHAIAAYPVDVVVLLCTFEVGSKPTPSCCTWAIVNPTRNIAKIELTTLQRRDPGIYSTLSASEWMSIFHPVRRAARPAFCPSLPMAKDSW